MLAVCVWYKDGLSYFYKFNSSVVIFVPLTWGKWEGRGQRVQEKYCNPEFLTLREELENNC